MTGKPRKKHRAGDRSNSKAAQTTARQKLGKQQIGGTRDPVRMIKETNKGRHKELVPIRHSRMLISPFTFYRGAAAVMAFDLAQRESSGIIVQSCGDCHILNCGAFATPERNVIIDLNDFDETHPAPFEWDLKRLAASLVLAIASVRLPAKLGERIAYELARAYQKEMAAYAEMRFLDVWYSKVDYQSFIDTALDKPRRKLLKAALAKERQKSSPEILEEKLITHKNGRLQFKEMPPLLFHRPDVTNANVQQAFKLYLNSLPADRVAFLKHFEVVDFAVKVVGTGSVGTFCAVALLTGPHDDLLILQVKEARTSVLEPYTQPCTFQNHGERIVVGQKIMQSASDMFLGWTKGESGRHFYVRQLRDVKMSPNPELWSKRHLPDIAAFAGKILAKAHGKSGEAAAIAEYIGSGNGFAEEIAKYAVAYAEQTESDYRLFADACLSGKLPVAQSIVGK